MQSVEIKLYSDEMFFGQQNVNTEATLENFINVLEGKLKEAYPGIKSINIYDVPRTSGVGSGIQFMDLDEGENEERETLVIERIMTNIFNSEEIWVDS